MSIEILNIYVPVVVWPTVIIVFILACNLELNIQSVKFYYEVSQEGNFKWQDTYIKPPEKRIFDSKSYGT